MRRPDLLSPLLAFPALWTLGAMVAQIHVLDFQGGWSTMAWIVIVAVPVAFAAGGFVGQAVARLAMTKRPMENSPPRPGQRSRRLLIVLVAIGWLEQIHQFAVAGVVPLFSANIDAARVSLPGGPTIALANALAVGAIVALAMPPRLWTRAAVPELSIAAIALAGYVAAGGRGTVLMPIVVALIARTVYWGSPPLRLVLGGGIVAAACFSALFYLRVGQGAVEPFDAELFGEVIPSTPWILIPLLPIYFALAMNFEALAAVVDTFPAVMPYGHGTYNALGLDIVFTGAQPLGAVSAELTPPWLTSTLAGPLWADGGLVLVVAVLIALGVVSCASHAAAHRAKEFRHALVFAYVLYLTLFCVYQNIWTQQIDWLFVVPGLFLVGAYVTNPDAPPGLAGRIRMIRLPRVTPGRGLIAAVLGALAILASAVVVAVSDIGGNSVKPKKVGAGETIPIGASLPLPPGALGPADQVVTDGDVPTDNEPLRIISMPSNRVVIDRFQRVTERRLDRLRRALGVAPPPAGTVFDVSHWDVSDDGVVFMLRDLGRNIDVRVVAPANPPRTIARKVVPVGRRETGTVREFAVARWSGPRPDLFVVQRGSSISRVAVSVFSGESSFSERILDIRTPVRGIDRRAWTVDVGRVAGTRPDLILINRGSRSAPPEVHVLDGDARFSSFLLQRSTRMRRPAAAAYRFAFGTSLGSAAIYALDSSRPSRPRLSHLLLNDGN